MKKKNAKNFLLTQQDEIFGQKLLSRKWKRREKFSDSIEPSIRDSNDRKKHSEIWKINEEGKKKHEKNFYVKFFSRKKFTSLEDAGQIICFQHET